LLSGSGQAAAYVSEASTFTSESNFLAEGVFSSSICSETGMGLAKEHTGSGCFASNRTDCAFDCMQFADADSCLAQDVNASFVPSNLQPTITDDATPPAAPTDSTVTTSPSPSGAPNASPAPTALAS
jgi:hypothetical protein